MLDRYACGPLPAKPHTVFRTPRGDLLYEHLFTRGGFDGPFTSFYHLSPPTSAGRSTSSSRGWARPQAAAEGTIPLQRRLYDGNRFWRSSAPPSTSGMTVDDRVALFFNEDLVLLLSRPTRPDDVYFANNDGDELWFVRSGAAQLESLCGWLDVTAGDYVLLPRSLPHRWHPVDAGLEMLCLEARRDCGVPASFRNASGQLVLGAPYTHRDFRRPVGPVATFDGAAPGPAQLLVKKHDAFTLLDLDRPPMDAVAWDGCVYPMVFPIRNFQPKTGQVHLPPTVHMTFAGPGYVVCSFVPRVTDYHPDAIPCPYPHSNVQCDEVILYLEGNFTSRRGVAPGCFSFHPSGLVHGPQPGAYEASVGSVRTDELAVMIDTFRPLQVTAEAVALEDAAYPTSWSVQSLVTWCVMASRGRRPPSPSLFETTLERLPADQSGTPLADRMRPRTLVDVVGQGHVLAPGKFLPRAIAEDRVPSMILWGPPGCGKTTLARVIAETTRGRFLPYSAVTGGVPELRIMLAGAAEERTYHARRTILFIDEIHRFHKGQQDVLLPDVERGNVVLIGATTENPSFAVNAALLSRCKVFSLEPLDAGDLAVLVRRALTDSVRGLGALSMDVPDDAVAAIVEVATGDARRVLTTLELAVAHARSLNPHELVLTRELVRQASGQKTLLYDKSGEEHYNVVSALIKSLRGSDPDAALYWLFRMLEAGDDPLFLSRRLIIFASEDVGNADPRALEVAVAADASFRRLGMPEGAYPLAHACLYLACSPKSDGVKRAMKAVRAAIDAAGPLPVPKKLRNAPTRLMKDEGYGANYRSPHESAGHVIPGETYLPEALTGRHFYEPTEQGFEKRIAQTLRERRR